MSGDRVYLSLTSADLASLLQKLTEDGRELFDLEYRDALTVAFWVRASDLSAILTLCEKGGNRVQVLHRTVKPPLRKRWVLILAFTLLLLLSMWLPTRVLFFRVEGNAVLSDRDILTAAQDSGIYFGANRSVVRSEAVKNQLLSRLPGLRWACVNTSGCIAVITVREKPLEKEDRPSRGQLYAAQDGVIVDMTVTSGHRQVEVGQAVRAGQLLVSDRAAAEGESVPVEAEVYAITARTVTVAVPTRVVQKSQISATDKKYSLLLGKKRINLYNCSGILHAGYDKMYTQIYAQLPGGFRLPFGVEVCATADYRITSLSLTEAECLSFARDAAEDYLRTQLVAGKLLGCRYQLEPAEDHMFVTFHFQVLEMIGRLYDKEINEDYGKDH